MWQSVPCQRVLGPTHGLGFRAPGVLSQIQIFDITHFARIFWMSAQPAQFIAHAMSDAYLYGWNCTQIFAI